jgi:hypothetical protein
VSLRPGDRVPGLTDPGRPRPGALQVLQGTERRVWRRRWRLRRRHARHRWRAGSWRDHLHQYKGAERASNRVGDEGEKLGSLGRRRSRPVPPRRSASIPLGPLLVHRTRAPGRAGQPGGESSIDLAGEERHSRWRARPHAGKRSRVVSHLHQHKDVAKPEPCQLGVGIPWGLGGDRRQRPSSAIPGMGSPKERGDSSGDGGGVSAAPVRGIAGEQFPGVIISIRTKARIRPEPCR